MNDETGASQNGFSLLSSGQVSTEVILSMDCGAESTYCRTKGAHTH